MDTFWNVVDVLLKIVGFLSIPLLVFSVILMVRGLKKYQPIQPKGLLIQMGIPVAMLLAYGYFMDLEPPKTASQLLFVAGAAAGLLASRTTRLELSWGQVFGKRNGWYLVAWAATFGITQLLALFARREYVAWGFSTLYFSLGLTLATNLALLMRRQAMLGAGARAMVAPAPAWSASAGTVCPGCGQVVPQGGSFCPDCGTAVS